MHSTTKSSFPFFMTAMQIVTGFVDGLQKPKTNPPSAAITDVTVNGNATVPTASVDADGFQDGVRVIEKDVAVSTPANTEAAAGPAETTVTANLPQTISTPAIEVSSSPNQFHNRFARFLTQAEAGDPSAMCKVGICLYQALGTKRNYEEGKQWLEAAAERGDSHAYYSLSVIYFDGIGEQPNTEAAFYYLGLAFEQHHPQAILDLATMREQGELLPKNLDIAFSLYTLAAQLGMTNGVGKAREIIDRGLATVHITDDGYVELEIDNGPAPVLNLDDFKARRAANFPKLIS